MSEINLEDFIPILTIQQGCVVSKRGDVTFGWRLFLPVAYTVNEPGYDAIITSFMQAYKLLPPYCIVHKQDIFIYDTYHANHVDGFLEESYEKHFEGRKFLNSSCYLFLTFSSKSVIEGDVSPIQYIRASDSKIPNGAYIEKCAGIASQFSSVLKNNALLQVVDLVDDDYLHVGVHGEDLGIIPDYLRLFDDRKSLDYTLRFDDNKVSIGDNELRCWFVPDSDAYPGMVNSVTNIGSMSTNSSQVFLSGGSPIGYQLQIPHIVNRYVITLPQKVVESELSQKKKLNDSFSLYSAHCRVNGDEIGEYLELTAKDSAITIKCFTDLLAWGKPEDIVDIRNNVVTAFSELDVTVTEEVRVAPNLYYAGIPSASPELGFNFYMTSEMNAFLCHGLWDGYDYGIPGGAIRLCDRKRMVPMNIDIQSRARQLGLIDNMNTVVVGPSGSGKSFTMNKLVQNFYNNGDHVLIVDVGDSYQVLCQVINEETGGKDGIYNTYDPDHPFGFNPFKGRKFWNEIDEDGDRKSSGYDFFLSLVETMYEPEEGWTKQMVRVLEAFINNFFDLWDNGWDEKIEGDLMDAYINGKRQRAMKLHKKFDESTGSAGWINPMGEIFPKDRSDKDPVFDNFFKYVTLVAGPLINDENYLVDNVLVRKDMFDIDKFGVALGKYKKGGDYGFLLNKEDEADLFSSRLTVFEVDMIKDNPDLFPLWMLCILHSFEDKMRSLPCQKVMVIEEAWSAIAKPTTANFIVWMWRTARKFRTSAVVVTQSLFDLTSSDIIKDAIIQNSSVKILLDQSKNANNFEESAKVLAFSQKDIGLVLSVGRNLNPDYKYKEGFFAIGEHYSNVFAIEVSEEEALAYESDKTLKKPLLDLAREKGSIIEAIQEKAEEKRRNKKC